MKPVLTYYGGKQRLSEKISKLFPDHLRYIEPFAGGASLFFYKKTYNNRKYVEVLNDLNSDIVNLYKVLQDKEKYDKLIHKLQFTLYSREEHRTAIDNYKNEDLDDVERAWSLFVNGYMSFSKILNAGFSIDPTQSLSKMFQGKVKNLQKCFDRLQHTYIEHIDSIDCIKKWDSPESLFYCDPPYLGANQGHYSGYTPEDFQRLIDTLDNIEGSFILSCYDTDLVTIPKHWERHVFDVNMIAVQQIQIKDENKKIKKREEIVYKVDRSKNSSEESKKLYKKFSKTNLNKFLVEND